MQLYYVASGYHDVISNWHLNEPDPSELTFNFDFFKLYYSKFDKDHHFKRQHIKSCAFVERSKDNLA